MIRVLRELLSIYDTSVRDEKSAWLLGYFTFFWAFFLDFIESKPFSYRHFRLFQQALNNNMEKKQTNPMGKVFTPLTIINRADESAAARGFISASEIRSVTLPKVLVDTGATTLCLPANIIARLGLDLLKEVDVSTATGLSKARVFQDAKILLCAQEGTFECLELPGGRDALT